LAASIAYLAAFIEQLEPSIGTSILLIGISSFSFSFFFASLDSYKADIM
jgi:hypothetical protein